MAREVWTLDCETDPFKRGRIPKPFLWGVYDGMRFEAFKTTAKMLDYVIDKDVILYAHNGGKFDFHFFLDAIPVGERLTVIDGRIVAFKIGRAEFRDSWTLLNVPLASYQKDKIDYSIFEADVRGSRENMAAIRDYLMKDCVYLHELVTGFEAEFGLSLTQASAAMKEFQTMRERRAPRGNASLHDQLKPYYYGGRVECLERGVIETRFDAFDIRSAYPFAMQAEHPFEIEFMHDTRLPKNDDEIGPCLVTLQARSRGALPFRERRDSIMLYPRDTLEREFNVTGWEYLAARDTDALDGCRVVAVKRPCETATFGDYVARFYALRAEAKRKDDRARDIFYKIMLNALYGKFAADPREYSTFEVYKAGKVPSDREIVANLGETVLGRAPSAEASHRFYNIATAASITGYVRAYLWRAMAQSKRVLYCDTDCIAAEEVKGIAVGDRLGEWSHEGEFDQAALAGRKLYAWRRADWRKLKRADRYKIASKGVRLNPAEIVRVARGEAVEFDPEVPTFSLVNGVGFTKRKVRKT